MCETPEETSLPAFNPDDWCSVPQAAKLRGVSPNTVYAAIRAGKLAPLKMGRSLFVRKADVRALPDPVAHRPPGSRDTTPRARAYRKKPPPPQPHAESL